MTANPPPPPPDEGGQSPPSYPGYAASSQPMGGMPSYPQGSGDFAAPATPPPSIQTAVTLMRAGAALSLLSTIIGLLALGSIKDNIAQQLRDQGTYSKSALDTAFNIGVATLVIVGVLGIALWLWMAHANGNGRKWARIVSTVLGVLNVLSLLVALSQGQSTTIQLILSVVSAMLAAVILVLLWRPESTAYYNARSRPQFS